MNFTFYDIILLVIFVVLTSVFLYKRRKNLKREGLLFLYKTQVGVKVIKKIGEKHRRLLNFLSYVSIGLGYVLMAGMLYFFYTIVKTYIFRPDIVSQIKIPPIMPLIPYVDKIVPNLNLPPFYFIYWIIIIAVIAISHEFSHGIFAVNKKVKIKSTGFGFFPFFLPVFLAAFVELDEKKMEKKKILPQMAVLSAGTFANLLTAIFFFAILVLFFSLSFAPSGVSFDTYSYAAVGLGAITSVNDVGVNNITYNQLMNMLSTTLNKIEVNSKDYLLTKNFLEQQTGAVNYVLLYNDAPAIKANLSSTIVKINGRTIDSRDKLVEVLMKYSPGDRIIVTGLYDDSFRDYEITLGKNPEDESKPYLGIGFLQRQSSGVVAKIMNAISSFKDPNIYYKANFGAAEFIYNLLWWLILISFSVALVNMLPVGIFDGGRFFFLTVLGITKNRKIAKIAFSIVTYLFLALLLVIMIFWAIGVFR